MTSNVEEDCSGEGVGRAKRREYKPSAMNISGNLPIGKIRMKNSRNVEDAFLERPSMVSNPDIRSVRTATGEDAREKNCSSRFF